MTTLRHAVASLALLALLSGLVVTIYSGFEDKYDIVREDTRSGYTIMERLDNLNLIGGVNDIGRAIEELKKAKLSILAAGDILGALATAGAGVLKTIGGVVTFVPEILLIITDFYYIPPLVSTIIGALTVLYVGFIILSKYEKDEV